MKNNKTVSIIGAGVGGITTSVFLAQQGYKVRVFEKNAQAGGRCSQAVREGHRFDLGATIYLLPGIYEQVFSKMGLDVKECFDLIPVETLYRLYFDDDSQLDFTHNQDTLKKQLEAIEPGSYKKARIYVKKGYEFLKIGLGIILDRNFYNIFQFITPHNIRQIVRIKGHLKHSNYIKRFFQHPHLRMAFTFQNIYVGQSPYNASALFSMLPGSEITEGAMFPKGGMHRIVTKMIEKAQDLGVEFVYNKAVSKINTQKNKVTEIEFEDGSVSSSDIFVANADLPYVYNKLLTPSWQSKLIKKYRYTCSAIVFHWAIDKVYPQLSQHNVFLVDEFKQALEDIFKKNTLSENPCFYLHAPTRSDKDAAPFGQDTISVVIPAPNTSANDKLNWDKVCNTARESIIKRLEKAGLKNLEDHIKFEICIMPEEWENMINLTKGATFGSLSHKIMQMGYFRPHNKHRKFQNLYFSGAGTHPGGGIPMVLLSGKLTSERIFHDQVKRDKQD